MVKSAPGADVQGGYGTSRPVGGVVPAVSCRSPLRMDGPLTYADAAANVIGGGIRRRSSGFAAIALPVTRFRCQPPPTPDSKADRRPHEHRDRNPGRRSEEHTSELQSLRHLV